MSFRGDDGGEATVISQLLIIGITAGVVFVAASYAYFAVDTAIDEADRAAARLSLHGATQRIESLSQQGVNASTAVPLPQQGEVTFRPFSPAGRAPDRIVILGTTQAGDVMVSGLDDGDGTFAVTTAGDLVIEVTWHWGLHAGDAATMGITSSGTYAAPGGRALVGVVSFHVFDADDPADTRQPLLVAVIADLHSLIVETGGTGSPDAAAMVGNMVLNGPAHVTSQSHIQTTQALAFRVWALDGPSFASSGDQQMHVQVVDQAWLAQAAGLDEVTVQAVGPHAAGILGLYERHGAALDGDSATFRDVTRLDIHGTHFWGKNQA